MTIARELVRARREGFLYARSMAGEHQCAAIREHGKCSVCVAQAERAFPMPIDFEHVSEKADV